MAVVEVSKRWYIGRGDEGLRRLENIQKLAKELFNGNVSKLVNNALDKLYHLDPVTGDPKKKISK